MTLKGRFYVNFCFSSSKFAADKEILQNISDPRKDCGSFVDEKLRLGNFFITSILKRWIEVSCQALWL